MTKPLINIFQNNKEEKITMNRGETEFNPDIQKAASTKFQKVDDIFFEKVGQEDPEAASVLSVLNTNGEQTEEELLEKAKQEIKRLHWWLQESFQQKGTPREQVSIRLGDYSAELYNYGSDLTPTQIEELERVVSTLAQIPGKKLKYIIIDNEGAFNDQNEEDGRGYAYPAQSMVRLYPRAMSDEPHRVPGTSGFAGTLIHEYGHILPEGTFWDDWRKKFGWKMKDEIDYSRKAPKSYDTDQEDRCITDYAKFSPDEDICESLVAAVNNPSILDQERLEFLKERWLKDIKTPSEGEFSLIRKSGDEVQLPKAPEKIKYKTRVSTFRVGTIKPKS